jgi:urease accessory protein UreE
LNIKKTVKSGRVEQASSNFYAVSDESLVAIMFLLFRLGNRRTSTGLFQYSGTGYAVFLRLLPTR